MNFGWSKMKLDWRYIIPCPIFYGKGPKGYGGYFNGFLFIFWIKIAEKYRDDQGLLEHELEHFRQFLVTGTMMKLLYLVNKKFRLWSEVMAYRRQLKFPPAAEDSPRYRAKYAGFISNRYKLKTSVATAMELLE